MAGNYSRSAIVTGATSGIGEATARKFAAAGFGVVGNGRNAAMLGSDMAVRPARQDYP